jgi:hypothetical protein
MISSATESTSTEDVSTVHATPPAEQGACAHAAYLVGYYLSFGVTYPTFWLASCIPVDSAVGLGLCDGAQAASDAHERFVLRAAAARDKIGDGYANIAANVGRRVEGFQDSMAERKHRRRIASA